MKIQALNNCMNRSVENRINIIGGSSLVHLRDDSPWSCRRQLAYSFLNYKPTEDETYTEAMQLGHYFEPLLREYASEYLKVNCIATECYYHDELPFIVGHPDGIFGENGIIEIKTAGPISYLNLCNKDIYESYKDQLTLYMGITNRYDAYFVIGNSLDITNDRFIKKFKWDEQRYDNIINNIVNFVCEIDVKLPDRCGKRNNGLIKVCTRCKFLTLCSPKISNKQFKNGESE